MSSFIGKMFGKKDQTPTAPEAIEKLRDTEDMLAKKQEFLEQKVEKETAFARQNAKTNKRAALAALKRKKRFETQLKNIDGTLSTIEMQREALESAANNTEVLKVMGTAAGAMKKAHNNLDVDQIEDMMDDIQEQQETARLISDAISNPVAFSTDYDEDDLLEELINLGEEVEEEEQRELDEKMLTIGPAVRLPDTPRAEPLAPVAAPRSASKQARRQESEDPDLADLASWAN